MKAYSIVRGAFLFILVSAWGFFEAEAVMTLEYHQRYYANWEELECNGEFSESNFLRLELVCSECGSYYNKYRITDDCRQNCFSSSTFKPCLDLHNPTDDMLSGYRNIVQSIAGWDPEF